MEAALTDSLGVFLLVIPLVEVVGGSPSRPDCLEAIGSHSLEPARERIRSALLLGDIQRFERLTLPELVGWAYSFSNSVSAISLIYSFPYSVSNTTNYFPC